MESGARAGLQTASDTAAMLAAQHAQRQKASKAMSARPSTLESQTIYRDASGRIINVALARAEARKVADAKAAKERMEREALTGDVQRREKEARREALEEAKFMPLARTVDDEELNRELKAQRRWNDPAAEFLTTTKEPDGGTRAGTGTGTTTTAKKVYKGAAPPNRYGIRPGHRWDGVDRGNGFERKWFESRNKRDRNERLAYEWQMDE
jgi:pre-mRNA-splicing factor CWC26